MRLPSLSRDYWQLLSAEQRHADAPESFEIPSSIERESLQPGQAAKLIFEIEGTEADGRATSSTERMWVVVTRRVADGYIGLLDNQPCTIRADEGFYLGRGCEVPFLPMHVISIAKPPPEYVAEKLTTASARRWPDAEG
jgi:hypothetical protein